MPAKFKKGARMSVDVDSVLVFGVQVSKDDFWDWIDKYTEEENILPNEFVDDWYKYVNRIDSYSDDSEWLIGIPFVTITPIKESLNYNESKIKLDVLLSKMFPLMPHDIRYFWLDQSGFISAVRWY